MRCLFHDLSTTGLTRSSNQRSAAGKSQRRNASVELHSLECIVYSVHLLGGQRSSGKKRGGKLYAFLPKVLRQQIFWGEKSSRGFKENLSNGSILKVM